ncbi:NAD(P)/FAD-dependent oxidoreductase [Georgenia sp. TF02-10]|uniref:NAD(P)/FAD-dependent oxidoreductase n=1 Tax=Georgenia sp. TF02-10 TaxID=2917725 RepID=UPI001FA814B0|nr:NAD(P)/FAD-dependent oxidoreductase [Georgenia sp. TF02-10]UNX54774.1 NAD(P)/FAD-dependent oxidoreductase [Georgenia sp. TF02-10]
MIDLVVAGGGPAGLATALHAARAGMSVVVREPRTGTIDKACGEGLMPGAVTRLARLGVDPPGQPLRGIRYQSGAVRAEARFPGPPGRGVRRTVLHEALRAAVADAGVVTEPRAVREVDLRADGVVVDGTPARYLVAADGLHSPLRRHLGLDAPARGRRRYGLRRHVAVAPWTDLVEVHWSAHAEAYVTPVGPAEVGVAVLTSRRLPYAEHLLAFPALADRLRGEPTSAVRGAGPLRQRARRRVAGHVLLVGDAGGYVDALTGEGISLALAQAEAAVAAMVAGRPGDYEAAWRRIGRRYRLLTEALLAASGPAALRRALVPAARALPPVFDAAVGELGRP